MENQVCTDSLAAARRPVWIQSEFYDLILISNVAWPLLCIPGMSTGKETVVDFWQIYFLTLPHRWITLLLVLFDKDRRRGQSLWLSTLALLIAVLVTGLYCGTGAFLCLGVIDYVWNAWHFASQHSGIARLYSKKVGGGSTFLEKWGLRGFITYTICRGAGEIIWGTMNHQALADQPPRTSILGEAFFVFDYLSCAAPFSILAINCIHFRVQRLPKLIYLFSVCSLYGGYLAAAHFRYSGWTLCFATAASLFHAVEYLAIVGSYTARRSSVGSDGWMRNVGRNCMFFMSLYVIAIGSIGWWAGGLVGSFAVAWQGLNVWAAFTHYAFDGCIWKLRVPATAQALGAP